MKIEIFKPFGEAFDLTKKILFQPFDLGKWCVIGFAAFLAGNFGGFGFNFSPGNFRAHRTTHNVVPFDLSQWKPWIVVAIAVLVLFFICFVLVLMWITSRGRFIFTDCIARNRGAIVAPWREYRREGNSYFLFSLVVMLGACAVFLTVGGIVFFAGAFAPRAHHTNGAVIVAMIVVFFVLWIAFAFFLGLTSYFMVPVMYRQRCLATEAFRKTLRLILDNLGSFILFCLFCIVLFMAMALIGVIATCLTCCLAAVPYVGTVILLPVFVCIRAFGLTFLRQFGPEYDVWGIPPQAEAPPPAQVPPPLPA